MTGGELGGPVWHVSARGATGSISWAMAQRALRSVGDAGLGEWRESGSNGVVHIRRRLTEEERMVGRRDPLPVRDIRGTEEEQRRFRRLFREAPHAQRFVS